MADARIPTEEEAVAFFLKHALWLRPPPEQVLERLLCKDDSVFWSTHLRLQHVELALLGRWGDYRPDTRAYRARITEEIFTPGQFSYLKSASTIHDASAAEKLDAKEYLTSLLADLDTVGGRLGLTQDQQLSADTSKRYATLRELIPPQGWPRYRRELMSKHTRHLDDLIVRGSPRMNAGIPPSERDDQRLHDRIHYTIHGALRQKHFRSSFRSWLGIRQPTYSNAVLKAMREFMNLQRERVSEAQAVEELRNDFRPLSIHLHNRLDQAITESLHGLTGLVFDYLQSKLHLDAIRFAEDYHALRYLSQAFRFQESPLRFSETQLTCNSFPGIISDIISDCLSVNPLYVPLTLTSVFDATAPTLTYEGHREGMTVGVLAKLPAAILEIPSRTLYVDGMASSRLLMERHVPLIHKDILDMAKNNDFVSVLFNMPRERKGYKDTWRLFLQETYPQHPESVAVVKPRFPYPSFYEGIVPDFPTDKPFINYGTGRVSGIMVDVR